MDECRLAKPAPVITAVEPFGMNAAVTGALKTLTGKEPQRASALLRGAGMHSDDQDFLRRLLILAAYKKKQTPVVPQNVIRHEKPAARIAKVTQRTELGPLGALPTARRTRVERGNRRSPMPCCAWIAIVEAHHPGFRSSSHSSMKAENSFQLRVVGVTTLCPASAGLFL